ncbi:MAG: FHA domain-containing protein [Planctomycetota bacterium]
MTFHETLDVFLAQCRNMGKTAFAMRYEEPFLVLEFALPEEDAQNYNTLNDKSKHDRPTEPIQKGEGKPLECLVVPLVKSDRNSFQNMVTLGRASNNDIVVSDPSVSKFHAYFRTDPSEKTISIVEAGSSFGTVLNGRALTRGEVVPLKSGDVLILSQSVRVTFLSSLDFFDYMQIQARMIPSE